MTAPRLIGPVAERRYGRRATDGGSPARFHAAAFVAQVAGLSIPVGEKPAPYAASELKVRAGLVADAKV